MLWVLVSPIAGWCLRAATPAYRLRRQPHRSHAVLGGIMASEAPSDPDRSREPSAAAHAGSAVGPTSGTLAPPVPQKWSPSLQRVWSELQQPCTAREVIEAIVGLHPEYGKRRAPGVLSTVQWPAEDVVRRQPVTDWYEDARSQLELGGGDLHGKAAIVGLALAERATGRELVRVGLFAIMVEDLSEGLTILNARGRERLGTIPLASLARNAEPYVISAGAGRRAKLSPDGRRAVCFGDDQISLWQVDGSCRLRVARTPGRLRTVRMARVTSDGAWLVALLDNGSLVRWQAESLTGLEVLHNPVDIIGGDLAKDASCAAIRLQPTGLAVLTVGNRRQVKTDSPLTGVALGPDGRLIAASTATSVEVFEWTGTELIHLESVGLDSALMSFDCGPTQVVAATGAGVRVIFGGEADRLSGLPLSAIDRVALSADGSLLAAAGGDRIYLVQPASGVVLAELPSASPDPRLSFSLNCRRFIASHDDGTAQIWDVGVEPPGRPPAAVYDSDVIDTDRDLLGRNRDVDAFASLIAAVAVQPPLSIGVFGDWGSGKSWFMRQIKRRVAEIAADAKGSGARQRELSFYKEIAQVEFNAWHYAETDVLTGLVEHIFNRLDIGDTAGIVEQEKIKALRALADAEQKAGENADEIRRHEQELAAIETQRREREKLRNARAAQLLHDASEDQKRKKIVEVARDALQAVGWGTAAEAFAGLIDDIDAASDELRRANPILTPLGDKQGLRQRQRAWMFALAGPVLGLLAGIIAWLAADRSLGLTTLSSLGGLITGLIVGISGIVQKSTQSARESLDRLAKQKNDIKANIKKELADIDKGISQDRAKEAEVRGTLEGLQNQHQELVQEVANREKKLAGVRPERLLQDLIKARVSSGDYSRHLGVIAQARRDFEKVSDLIRAVNDSLTESSDPEKSTTINRVVLYIDDLDRCEPSKGVRLSEGCVISGRSGHAAKPRSSMLAGS